MQSTAFDPQLDYSGVPLRAEPYPLRVDGCAQIPDDGIVDEVAVRRTLTGRRPARLTPREVVAVVVASWQRGRNDEQVARTLDGTAAIVSGIRERHGLPAAE